MTEFTCAQCDDAYTGWCKQHDPREVRMRWEKAAKKAREREQAKILQDRMFEPVEGWVWCDMDGLVEREGCCPGRHRKIWVERTGGSND